ncbi:hypothetical protein ABI59_12530 [Acidobacteria bacterium Mor1]|nr:hypothetical protein ABI59_12530 [Acidobacteria bacterium Mor1]
MLPRLRLGVEYNSKVDEVGPLLNWVAMTETGRRPALIFGTSSDRIGTDDGQAYFFTFSKSLDNYGLPIAPYVGAAYGEFDAEWTAIGGVRATFGPRFSSTVIYDGKRVHPTLDAQLGGSHVLSLVWVDTDNLGAAYSVTF